ncbi:MAG: ATP-binding cassette domain-containing protein [Pseudobdellovibrionaceae bacterium]
MSSNLLQMQEGYKSYGTQILFDQATFAINEGEHVGVIGPNGAGKSTLFKILIKSEELDSGKVICSQSLRLGYLSQHDEWEDEETGNSYLEKVCRLPVWQAKLAGQDMQVSEEIFDKPILSLSGGYRMRIKLIGLLGMDPNLMLLDEPTNYLDLETTLLLEKFLQNYEGAFLLISHDREVLRRTTDHILEVESGEITKFSGNIDDYFEQKELLRSQLEAQAQNQALKRKAVMDFVTRFGAQATKARQAQSRLKSLDRMENIELKALPVKASIQIPPPPHVGKSILQLSHCEWGYQDRTILQNVNMQIQRGDHIAIVGYNGAGKSTLLKGIAGTLLPQSGLRETGYQVEMAIFNQHVIEVLNPEHTVFQSLESVTRYPTSAQDVRNMAGSLLFSTNQIDKKIKVLSGGEKSRVALGRILLQNVACLLLDEPTNHLDFQTVEALTQALNKFSGTVIVVSHDRNFVRRVGHKILEVKNGDVHLYPGSYDDYVWSLQQALKNAAHNGTDEFSKTAASAPAQKKTTLAKAKTDASLTEPSIQNEKSDPTKLNKKELDKQKRLLEKRIEQLSKELQTLEEQNQKLNQKISQGHTPDTQLKNPSGEKEGLLQWSQQMAANSVKIQNLEVEWLQLTEQIEGL